MAKIIISGYYGFDNLGDEAILMAMVSVLKSVDQKFDLLALSNSPDTTEKRYQIPSINRNNLMAVFKEIKGSDMFISGGGSLLQDITGWKSIPFYLGQVFIAQLMGKKTVFYSQGIGPVKNRFYQWCIKMIMNRSDLVSVRDIKSKELLLQWGVKEDKVELTIDPAFVLKTLLGDYTKNKEEQDKPLIGVSVRPWADNEYLRAFANGLAKFAQEINGDIIILPLHLGEDQEISKELKEILLNDFKKTGYRGGVFLERFLTPLDILGKYQEIDFFFGVRLHSIIFSTISKIPFVALEYDPKVKGLLNMIGINSGLKIEELDSEVLYRISMSIWKNSDQFKAILKEKTDLFAKLSLKNAIDLSKLIVD